MYSRKIRLLRAIVENENLSSQELMEKLSIGQRTLRSEISELNEMLRKEKVSIHSGSGGGYYVKSSDKAVIQKYLDSMIRQSKRMVLPETSRERFLFGFAWLFFRREPVSIQRAAEKLCASNTAVLHTKKQIQDTLTWYPGLRLETGTRGMWISGSEAEKRHALAQFINYSTFGSIMMERLMTFLFGAGPYEDYMAFYRGLPDILAAQGCRLIDKSVEGFALDLFVTLMRSQKGFVLDGQETPDSCPCVDALAEWVEKVGYTLSARDKAYLTECLQARRILYTLGKDDASPEEYIEVTREFLTAVDQEFGTEYRRNEELCGKLSVHIQKMILRIQGGYFETNTILQDVSNRYGREMDMARKINGVLEKRYGAAANVHEISYLAIYLRAYSSRKLSALVLCDLGEGIADNMVRQITQYCGEGIRILGISSLNEYRRDPLPVDILISPSRIYNVHLPEKTKIFYVDYLLKETQLKKIQDYLLKNTHTE